MSIAEKFQKLRETKEALRVIAEATVEEPFSSYPTKIQEKMNSEGSTDEFWNIMTKNGTTLEAFFSKKSVNNDMINYIKTKNLSNIKNMSYIFFQSTFESVSVLDFSNINLSNVANISYAFNNVSVNTINLTNSNLKPTNMSSMFANSNNLHFIYGIIDISTVTASYAIGMFNQNNKNLYEIYLKNLSNSINISYCTNMIKECLVYLLENAIASETTRTITLGSTNLAKLTAEEIAVGTNKGYTIS